MNRYWLRVKTLVGIAFLVGLLGIKGDSQPARENPIPSRAPSIANPLVDASLQCLPLFLSDHCTAESPEPSLGDQATKNIARYQNYLAYHSLYYLYTFYPDRFEQVPRERVVSILISALQMHRFHHDFGLIA